MMYVITVEFVVKPEHVEAFREQILRQAANSFEKEAECHQFEVCFDPEDETRCFLYELYSDRTAFDAHLATPHFAEFDAAVKPMLVSKQAESWLRAET